LIHRVADKSATTASERADVFLVRHGYAASRAEAQAAIAAGKVQADGKRILKPSQILNAGMKIDYAPAHPFVSRGGVKLAAALDRFGLSPEGAVCLDIGASTGGFTEVLLSRGAARVYAVDVGHGQLHEKIRSDPRVVVREGLNARDLSLLHVPEAPQVILAQGARPCGERGMGGAAGQTAIRTFARGSAAFRRRQGSSRAGTRAERHRFLDSNSRLDRHRHNGKPDSRRGGKPRISSGGT
jgi:hypothetical protein